MDVRWVVIRETHAADRASGNCSRTSRPHQPRFRSPTSKENLHGSACGSSRRPGAARQLLLFPLRLYRWSFGAFVVVLRFSDVGRELCKGSPLLAAVELKRVSTWRCIGGSGPPTVNEVDAALTPRLPKAAPNVARRDHLRSPLDLRTRHVPAFPSNVRRCGGGLNGPRNRTRSSAIRVHTYQRTGSPRRQAATSVPVRLYRAFPANANSQPSAQIQARLFPFRPPPDSRPTQPLRRSLIIQS